MDELDKHLRSPEQPLVTQNYRFLGFVNDVGEAMASFLPRSLYIGSYVVTGVYAVAAVYYDRAALRDKLDAPSSSARSAAEKGELLNARTLDNALWHTLATVTLTPLIVIPAIKVGAKRLLAGSTGLSAALREKVLPATIAIVSIPAVVSPVDNAVTWGFNQVRKTPEPYHWTGYWPDSMNSHHHPTGPELK
jgi:hypothetical protein